MSDRPTSFHDFKWACGHTGPGYCKTCRDEQIKAKDKRIAELEVACNEYRRTLKALDANKQTRLEAENERLRADVKTHFEHGWDRGFRAGSAQANTLPLDWRGYQAILELEALAAAKENDDDKP